VENIITPTPSPTDLVENTITPTPSPTLTNPVIVGDFNYPAPKLPMSGLKTFQRNVRNSRRRSG
jgi:hypothetical protein